MVIVRIALEGYGVQGTPVQCVRTSEQGTSLSDSLVAATGFVWELGTTLMLPDDPALLPNT